MFDTKSRYGALPLRTYGGTIRYVGRRIVPQPSPALRTLAHTVVQGERLDTIAAHYFGDPLQFWRVCDANRTVRPTDLTASPGLAIAIPGA